MIHADQATAGVDPEFWRGQRVFLTGHTGFKGAWLSLWLQRMGAHVTGFSLAPEEPSLFALAHVADGMDHRMGDIRNPGALHAAMSDARPDVVFHLAAQSLVRRSYAEPVETFDVNVMGTVYVLEAVRQLTRTNAASSPRAVVVVTSDKCYRNEERMQPYREDEPLGGHDPYSSSKACAELVTASYRDSFARNGGMPAVASARAGNVIGGGDWAQDRLVPDAIAAFGAGRKLLLRNPKAVRPWQHVLEPLCGYLVLAQHLVASGSPFDDAWNFGPDAASECSVGELVSLLAGRWGDGAAWTTDGQSHPHEAQMLKLDSTRARTLLGWQPRLGLRQAVELTVDWYRAQRSGGSMRALTVEHIRAYCGS